MRKYCPNRLLPTTHESPRNSGARPTGLVATLCLMGCLLIAVKAVCQTRPPVTIRPVTPIAKPRVSVTPNIVTPSPPSNPDTNEAYTSAADVLVIVDGKVVSMEGVEFVRGQQLMVWLRDIERLGWGTVQAELSGQVSLINRKVTLTFRKAQDTALVNSLAVRLPIKTYMRDTRFMVPMSFVAKSLGHEYDCSYRPVAFVMTQNEGTTPNMASAKKPLGNTLEGIVLYNGTGVFGVKIRTVDKDMTVIDGAETQTDAIGQFAIKNLPDGEFAAYVYTGDNPVYFNRATEVVSLGGKKTIKLKPLSLGKVITPVSPASGEKVSDKDGGVEFIWNPCDGAVEYRLTLKTADGNVELAKITAKEAKVVVPVNNLAAGTSYIVEIIAYDKNGEFIGGTPGTGSKPWILTFVTR